MNRVGGVLVPIIAATNYHKLTGLKQHKFIIFQSFGDQKTEMGLTGLKLSCQQGCVPSTGSRGIRFLTFPASKGHPHSLAHEPFFHLQSQQHNIETSDSDLLLPYSTSKGLL